jgi:hypothetical protein
METGISYSFFHLYRSENDLIHKVKTFYLTFFCEIRFEVVLTVRKCGFYHFVVVVVVEVVVVVVVYPFVPLET